MNNPLAGISFSFQLEEWMLWLFLVVFVFLYSLVTLVLLYHWRKYGRKHSAIVLAEIVFLLVSALLIYMAIIGVMLF